MIRRLALLLLAAPAAAQEVPAASTPAVETLDFGVEGLRMTVPVSIAGAGPFRFVIDTGAERTVISRELAGVLGLSRGRDVRLTAMTGTSSVGTVVVPSLSVSTMGAERVEAPALAQVDMGAPGILGIDSLQGHVVQIDFDTRVMTVAPSTRRGRGAPAARDEIVVRAKNLLGQLVVTDAHYRGARIRIVLDTGAAVSMGNEPLRRLVARKSARVQDLELIAVTGDRMNVGYTSIDRVALGDVTFANLPVAFSSSAPFRRFGLADKPAMLLGMDALRLLRRVRIDFANREVRLLMPRGMRKNVLAGADPLSGPLHGDVTPG